MVQWPGFTSLGNIGLRDGGSPPGSSSWLERIEPGLATPKRLNRPGPLQAEDPGDGKT